jgi:hypothetical protein
MDREVELKCKIFDLSREQGTLQATWNDLERQKVELLKELNELEKK